MGKPAAVRKVPRRIWTYPRGQWDGPLLLRSGDEYGRKTLALRLPGHRALVWAYRWCRDPDCCDADRCPGDGFPHQGWVNGKAVCEHCNPGSTACPRCGLTGYNCRCFDAEMDSLFGGPR